MATLETRISDLEKKAGIGAGGRLDRIRLVGINSDGTEGDSVVIWESPLMKNGNLDLSAVPDDDLRKLARHRIEDAD
jgi:hypothetical protein